jgi:hypothetical protein
MTDWIAWTRCSTCDYGDKSVFQQPDDAPHFDPTSHVICPKCGNPTRCITFPAFDIQSFDVISPDDAMYETMGDW